MADPIRVKRGSRAQLNTAATANQLMAGEPYLITDEGRFAVGRSASTYETFGKQSENVPFPGYRSAQWHNFQPLGSTVAAANLVINVLRAYIIKIEAPITLTQRSLTVGTANAGSLVRVGLYQLGAGFYPTTLVANSDIAQIDAGVTGAKTNPFSSPISLAAGYYGLAYACNGVLANLTCYALATTAFIPLPERAIAQPTNRLNGWTGAFAFSTLPSTYPVGHTPIQFTTTSPEVLFLTQ
jgi:hypothetical protein